MVIAPICIFWVVVFTHDTQATAPEVPPLDIGDVCAQLDAEHPLMKRSTGAVLLGGCCEVPARKPRIAALLRAPGPVPSEMDGAGLGPACSAPQVERTTSPEIGAPPLELGAGVPPSA